MQTLVAPEIIDELINCSFPLNAIIFEPYCNEYKNINPLQVCILNLVFDHKKLNMTHLAKRLGYTNQRITQPVEGLVQRGYLKRIREDTNRRMTFLSITDEGAQYLLESRAKAREIVMAIINKALNEQEQQHLCHSIHTANLLLEKLNNDKI